MSQKEKGITPTQLNNLGSEFDTQYSAIDPNAAFEAQINQLSPSGRALYQSAVQNGATPVEAFASTIKLLSNSRGHSPRDRQ